MWIDSWVFYSAPLVLLSVLMTVPGCFLYCSSVVMIEERDCDTSSSFIVLGCFGYTGFFVFQMNLSAVLLKSLKNFALILMGIVFNL